MPLPFKKRKLSELKNAEDVDTGGSGSLTAPMGTNSGGSSSSPTESNDGVVCSSSTAPTGNNYEVFLSFRGLDTRNSFADHLYRGLIDAGIDAFRDNEGLRQGKKIGPDLLAAIKKSKISIPILSENYGSSKWCLDELVQIMECKNSNTGHIVLPIFYKVAPGDVRHQIGKFGEAFHERERRSLERRGFDPAILKKWKQALEEVGDLKGREANGSEVELVKSVVRQVLLELKKKFELVIPENLVGIGHHMKKIMNFIDDNSRAAVFVGIHGMGGIGKSTLAKTIYYGLSNRFECRSLIADIRESCKRNGIEYLQNQLISDTLKLDYKVSNRDEGKGFMSSNFKNKKVLILLDDVDAEDHLKNLAQSRDWFSSGSVIIITTRNKSILDNAEVDYNYELEEMDMDTSSILFCRHAFGKDAPPPEFEGLTHDVVCTTGGLPLSLEVVGSFLRGREPAVWKGTIKKLRNVPHKKVREKLMISYDALDYGQQHIFLDIACFFIGADLRIASYMWDACEWYPNEGIVVLRLMSLIKVGENHELKMHDQLRDLGREIVRLEDMKEPRHRSRLWDSKEVLKVLEEDEGATKIEAIYLREGSLIGFGETTDRGDNILTGKQFKKLRNLRFLDANGARFTGDFENSVKKLKWLQWKNCPSTFEATKFNVEELRVLNLGESYVSDKWQGWSWIKMAKELKYLDLTNCTSLKKTSFLSAFENLEVLILARCCEIEQIDPSIGNMKSLVRLDLRSCWRLKGLPAEVGKLKALEQLFLDGGPISSLPDSIGDLQNLKILSIERTRIEELPNSIWGLQNLEILSIEHTMIEELPNRIRGLRHLEILNIRGSKIKKLPDGIEELRKLRELDASDCSELGGVSESIRNLSSLQRLDLYLSFKLQSLPVLPSSLTYLRVTCRSPRLPLIYNLTHLKELTLYCIPLEKFLNTPSKLEILNIDNCRRMKTLDVSEATHLRKLYARFCSDLLEIRGLDKLKYLERLSINYCPSIERLDLSKHKVLKNLWAQSCKNLIEIQGLDGLESLERLEIIGCDIVRLDLPKFNLKIFRIQNSKIQVLDGLESLEEILVFQCASIKRLDLSKCRGLKKFEATRCENLSEIQGADRLESLEEMSIDGCTSIRRLDLSKSKGLKKLSLLEIQGLDRLEFLEGLSMWGCTSFGRLPDLCCFDTLHHLAINCCDKFCDIQSLERFPSLKTLSIDEDNNSFAKFPKLRHLRGLRLSNCHELREILGIEELTSLEWIDISNCSSIEILPDLSSLTNLKRLAVDNCEKLTELRGLEKLEYREKWEYRAKRKYLAKLDIRRCKSLKTTPELRRWMLQFEPVLEEE